MTGEESWPIRYGGISDAVGGLAFFGAFGLAGWIVATQFGEWFGWLMLGFGALMLWMDVLSSLSATWVRLDADGIHAWRRGRSRTIPWHHVRDVEAGDWDGPSVVRLHVRDRMGAQELIEFTPAGGPGVYRVRDQLLELASREGASLVRPLAGRPASGR